MALHCAIAVYFIVMVMLDLHVIGGIQLGRTHEHSGGAWHSVQTASFLMCTCHSSGRGQYIRHPLIATMDYLPSASILGRGGRYPGSCYYFMHGRTSFAFLGVVACMPHCNHLYYKLAGFHNPINSITRLPASSLLPLLSPDLMT